MPQSVTYEGSVMRYRLWGIVTKQDLADLSVTGRTLERSFPIIPSRIVDFSELTNIEDGYYAMLGLVDRRKKEVFPNRFRTAMYAKNPLQFGLSRMFQTLNDNPQIEVRIFETEAAALAWLASGQLELAES